MQTRGQFPSPNDAEYDVFFYSTKTRVNVVPSYGDNRPHSCG